VATDCTICAAPMLSNPLVISVKLSSDSDQDAQRAVGAADALDLFRQPGLEAGQRQQAGVRVYRQPAGHVLQRPAHALGRAAVAPPLQPVEPDQDREGDQAEDLQGVHRGASMGRPARPGGVLANWESHLQSGCKLALHRAIRHRYTDFHSHPFQEPPCPPAASTS
jgi:hypothetical protein